MKLFQIVLNIAIGIAAGAQPIVGYNYGAGKYGRVKELLKLIIGWTVIVCLVCTVLFEAIPQVFICMFGADGELYTQFAVGCLRIYLSLIVFTCVQKVCAIFLQSIGHAKAAAPLSVLRDVFLIVLSLIVPVFLGVTGIFLAAPAADVLAIAITAVVMVRLWKQLSGELAGNVTESVLPEFPSKEGVVVILTSVKIFQFLHGTGCIIGQPVPCRKENLIAREYTISREHGSAGKRIGQLVAKQMGIPCYYKEMIAVAAHESGLTEAFISNINSDENTVMRELYLYSRAVRFSFLPVA